MTDIIRPPHAAYIWANNDILFLELPNAQGGNQTHTLRLPLNVFGLTQAVALLKERGSHSRISTKGDPTQGQTDKAIAELVRGFDPAKVKKGRGQITITEERRSTIRDVLRKVGLA
jgi:hypothetical protein